MRFLVSSRKLRLVAAMAALQLVLPASVSAYDPNGAVSWADNQALNPNCMLSPCFNNDCVGFVSQVLWWGGGYKMAGVGLNANDDHNWWMKNSFGAFSYSRSWSTARYQYNFQILHAPGGTLLGKTNGLNAFTTSGLVKGDLIFYDWTGDGIIDHVGIQVGHGTDPDKGWFGDYTDQHNTNRFHSFWSLKPYNAQRGTTVIYLVRISSSN